MKYFTQRNFKMVGTIILSLSFHILVIAQTGADITSFVVTGATGDAVIDATNHTVTIEVSTTTSNSLAPTIGLSTSATVSPESDISQTFQNGIPNVYTVTAGDGATTQDWEVTINWVPYSGGTYKVGSGGDFAFLSQAITAIRKAGIGGDVVLALLDGHVENASYYFFFDRYVGSDLYFLTIQPDAGATNITITCNSSGGCFQFRGVENLTFDGGGVTTLTNRGNGAYFFFTEKAENGNNFFSKNITINNCNFVNKGPMAVIEKTSGIIIENSSFQYSGSPLYSSTGISVINTSDNITIRSNKFLMGVAFDGGDLYSLTGISGNFGADVSALIYNNYISLSPTEAGGGIRGMDLTGGSNTEIYHNTINITGGAGTNDMLVHGIRVNSSATNSEKIQNNIISIEKDPGNTQGLIGIKTSTTSVSSDHSFNNIYLANNGAYQTIMNIDNTDYADINNKTLQSLDITNVQPVFTDAANGDLSLTGTSLASDDLRGTPIASVTTDINGTSRSIYAPSKGAHETPNNLTNITAFSLSEQTVAATINTINHTVAITVNKGTDPTSLIPKIRTSPGATISPLTGVAQDFSSPVNYTVTAEDATEQIWEATVTVEPNSDPTDITLTSVSVDENTASGTAIATLDAADANTNDTHTFTLVAGTGDADNASFTITGDQLKVAEVFDFETKSSYSIRIKADDGDAGIFEKEFIISVNDVAEAPTGITLSSKSIAENNSVGDNIGTLTTTDSDNGETYAYSLVAGTGDIDNASFTISNDQLNANLAFNFEDKNMFYIRIQTNDGNGGTFQKEFTIMIVDTWEAPTDITLDVNSVDENAAVSTVVGTLSTIDEDPGDNFTYTLVAGTGDVDNGLFSIAGAELQVNGSIDYESTQTLSVRIRTTPTHAAHAIEKAFTINVNDLDEIPPTLSSQTPSPSATGIAIASDIVLTFDEEVQAGTGTVTINQGGSIFESLDITGGRIAVSGSTVTINPTADFSNNAEVEVIVPAGVITDLSGNEYAGISAGNWTFVTEKASQTVTFDAVSSTLKYGDAPVTLGATATSGGVVTFTVVSGPGTVAGTELTITGAGTIVVRADQAGDATYTAGANTLDIITGKATLTATANDITTAYGSTPAYTITYTGFIGTDDASTLDTAPTASSTGTTVGSQTITASGGVDTNYDFTYVAGTLTITKAMLTVTANNQTIAYGDALPTFTVTYAGFVGTDDATVLDTAPTVAAAGTTTGTHAITASGGADANYDFTYVDGTLTISKAMLTVTAENLSMVYGSALPSLAFAYTGFVGTDDASVLDTPPTAATTATDASDVGVYPITLSGGADADYDFTYANAEMTITQATATITLADMEQVVTGSALEPTVTTDPAGLAYTITYDGGATAPSAVGTYAVVATINETNYTGEATGNFVIAEALGLEALANVGAEVYPNPVSDYLHLSWKEAKPRQLALYNTAGKMVYQMETSDRTHRIDMRGQSNGLFHLIIAEKGGKTVSVNILRKN